MVIVNAYRVTKTLVEERVEDRDLITLTQAAEISGFTISGIVRLIQRDALPEYKMLNRLDDNIQSFTSRAVVLSLKKNSKKKKTK